jgi:hypothetical protein
MPETPIKLRLDGLTALQLEELKAAVGDENIAALPSTGLGGGKLGEPALLTLIATFGPSVISALAIWLAKQKKSRTSNLRYSRIRPDGTSEDFIIRESVYDEGESPVAGIKAFLEETAHGTAGSG